MVSGWKFNAADLWGSSEDNSDDIYDSDSESYSSQKRDPSVIGWKFDASDLWGTNLQDENESSEFFEENEAAEGQINEEEFQSDSSHHGSAAMEDKVKECHSTITIEKDKQIKSSSSFFNTSENKAAAGTGKQETCQSSPGSASMEENEQRKFGQKQRKIESLATLKSYSYKDLMNVCSMNNISLPEENDLGLSKTELLKIICGVLNISYTEFEGNSAMSWKNVQGFIEQTEKKVVRFIGLRFFRTRER